MADLFPARETLGLREALGKERALPGQLDLLRGRYAGQRCLVVSCGPSLSSFRPESLASRRDLFVIAVKQAVEVCGAATDILCFNSYNVRRLEPSETVVAIWERPVSPIFQFNRWEVALPSAERRSLSDSVAAVGGFEAHTLDRTPVRPFGPGVLYSLGFFLAVHLGATEITTVGWDIADASGQNRHFDEVSRTIGGVAVDPRLKAQLPRPLLVAWRLAAALVRHYAGTTYNPARMMAGEAAVTSSGSKCLSEWLRSRGIRLRVVSDSTWIDGSIERLAPSLLEGWIRGDDA